MASVGRASRFRLGDWLAVQHKHADTDELWSKGNLKCKLCLRCISVPTQRWEQSYGNLAELHIWDVISGHLVGLRSIASLDSSRDGHPSLTYPHPTPPFPSSHCPLCCFWSLKAATSMFEWQRRGRGAPQSSFSHILFEGANMYASLQATAQHAVWNQMRLPAVLTWWQRSDRSYKDSNMLMWGKRNVYTETSAKCMLMI